MRNVGSSYRLRKNSVALFRCEEGPRPADCPPDLLHPTKYLEINMLTSDTFYSDDERELQKTYGTEKLANAVFEAVIRDEIEVKS